MIDVSASIEEGKHVFDLPVAYGFHDILLGQHTNASVLACASDISQVLFVIS